MRDFSLLAIETATEACSAALYVQGKIFSRFKVASQEHAALILEMCENLHQEANLLPVQLTVIAFGRGPGSFTGVRIAAAVVQGIAVAHQLPVIAVSSLQALAQAAYLKERKEKVLAGIDARMHEAYVGEFILEKGIMILRKKETLVSMQKLPAWTTSKETYFCAGSAFQKENIIFPSAEAIIPIALKAWQENKVSLPEEALPLYVRDKVV